MIRNSWMKIFSTIEIEYDEALRLLDRRTGLAWKNRYLRSTSTIRKSILMVGIRKATVLPCIEETKFSGEYFQWQSFKD